MSKAWYSIYDFSFDYKGNEPAFTDPYAFPWAKEFETNFEKLKAELEEFLKENKLRSYFSQTMVEKKDSWRTISLLTWGIELYKVQKYFPYITSVLHKYPQIVSASFSLLENDSRIIPHCGDTNAVYRCHMGIDVPAGLPYCGLRVKGEDKAWENGKWFAFMDAYMHEAWNTTPKERLVFIVDVMRPEFKHEQKKVCATVRTSLFLQKRIKDLKSREGFVKGSAKLLRPFIQLGIATANTLKFY